ncbi:hypothetical protein D3C73_996880 [compost metagenome]
MLVEATVGKARSRHQVCDAHTVVATLPEERGRGFDNVRPVGLRLCLGDLHDPMPQGLSCGRTAV